MLQVEDERKAQQSMADQNNALQSKVKLFKQQLEEAVSIFCNFFLFFRKFHKKSTRGRNDAQPPLLKF